MSEMSQWTPGAAGNSSASPDGFPEGMAPSGVNDSAREIMGANRRQKEADPWFDWGHTPTFISATSFSVVGDQTAVYLVNDRIKLVGSTPFTVYATLATVVFSTVTTITYTVDSGTVDATLTNVSVSPISATNTSVPAKVIEAAISGLQRNFIDGVTLENDADADHAVKVNEGATQDSTNSQILTVSSSGLVKRTDASWAEGTGNGGFPTGISLAVDTWYHFFLIAKIDGTVDAGFDTSITAANLLTDATDYTLFKLVESVLTDGSSNIIPFIQTGDTMKFAVPISDYSSTITTSAALLPLTTPLGRVVKPLINAWGLTTAAWAILLSSPSETDTAPALGGPFTLQGLANEGGNGVPDIFTDTSSQIRARSSVGTPTLRLTMTGWTSSRGRDS